MLIKPQLLKNGRYALSAEQRLLYLITPQTVPECLLNARENVKKNLN